MYGINATAMNAAIGQREGLLGGCTAPVQESELMYAGRMMEIEINNLHSVINNLHERLNPVMTEPYPAPPTEAKIGRNVTSVMAKALIDGSRQVTSASDRLNEILSRLAV